MPSDTSPAGTPLQGMDSQEIIRKCRDFLEQTYYAELLERSRKGEHSITLTFSDLAKFDPALGDALLDHPEEILKALEVSLNEFELPTKPAKFAFRFQTLPDSAKIMIRHIRSEHLSKLLWTEGVVRQKSDVRPQVSTARFECPSCGSVISIIQLDLQFKEPYKCSCGRKGKFRLLSKELNDCQNIVLEEVPEQLDGGEQPKRMNVFLKNDLVSPMTEKRTNPGSRILVVGQVKEVPIIHKSGGQSTRFDLLIEANNVLPIEEDFMDITISPEELAEIKKLSTDPKIYERMAGSLAPSIYGHERIKEALVLQLLGGVRKSREDGVVTRGDMHILLIGDPGAAKSQMLRRVAHVAPKARYVTGKGASGAGLSASVVKDEFLQGWSLEAGALVLANKGLCCIDELDKMSKEDSWSMHEALEQQTVTISKANIQATLRAETTVLAAANPKFGRFDPYETVANQIDLPPTLINRFDLIFPIKDVPDPQRDNKMAAFVLRLHQNTVQTPDIETKLLRKYVAYARQHMRPVLSDGAVEELREYYIKMRSSGSAERGHRSIPISARQLEGLVRISEATAKLRLSDTVTRKDAKKAVELLDFCLRQVALDEETGTIDIDRISSDVPASQRNKIMSVKEAIAELEAKVGKIVPLEDVAKASAEKGVGDAEFDEIIEKLKRAGDVWEPRNGFVSRI